MFQDSAATSNSTVRWISWQKPVWQSSKSGQCLVISGKQPVCTDLFSTQQQRRHLSLSTLSAAGAAHSLALQTEVWHAVVLLQAVQTSRCGLSMQLLMA
jgi:hypothetical protein